MVKTKQPESVALHTHMGTRGTEILFPEQLSIVLLFVRVYGEATSSLLAERVIKKMMYELYWDRLVLQGEVRKFHLLQVLG